MDKIATGSKEIYGKEKFYPVRVITTIRDMFLSSCELFADRTLYLVKDAHKQPYRHIKYKEYKSDVVALATALFELGLGGKKVAVIGENSYKWEVSYMSVVTGVGTVVPIDKELPADEIKNLLDLSEASAIVYSGKIYKKNQEMIDSLNIIKIPMEDEDGVCFSSLIEDGNELLCAGDTRYADAVVKAEDVNILLFTSGTTGVAKGVMLSHENIANNLMNMCSMVEIRPDDRFFSLLPLHHTYECTCGFLCPIYRGSSIAFCEGLKYIGDNMKEAQPTVVLAVPAIAEAIYGKIVKQLKKMGKDGLINTMIKVSNGLLKVGLDVRRKLFKQILDNLGGKLRLFITGAAPGNIAAIKWFKAIGVYAIQGYGLTECAPIVALNRLGKHDDLSCGLPLVEGEVKIVNTDENGNGEIIYRGKNIMVGYYNNEEATKEVIKDGWFYTGDIGYMKDGFIYINGRAKNVIITANGKNVFPEELEKYINKLECVTESMVYATADENGHDNVITAQVYPDYELLKSLLGENAGDEEIDKYVTEKVKEINKDIPVYKAVTKVIVRREPFVKTTTQKIKRFANM